MKGKALFSALLGNFIFGFSFLFISLGLNTGIPPKVFLAYRYLCTFIVLSLILILQKKRIPLKNRPWYLLVLLGVFQPSVYALLESYGLIHSNTTFTSIMTALIPIISVIGGAILLRERPTKPQWFFSLLSIGGVFLLILGEQSEGRVDILGVLFLTGAVLCGASYNILSRKTSSDFTPFERSYFMFSVGAIFFFFLGLGEAHWNIPEFVSYFTKDIWIPVLFLGICCSAVAFTALNYAVTHLPISQVVVFGNLTVIVAVLAGIFILNEPASLRILISLILVLLGVVGVQVSAVQKK